MFTGKVEKAKLKAKLKVINRWGGGGEEGQGSIKKYQIN